MARRKQPTPTLLARVTAAHPITQLLTVAVQTAIVELIKHLLR